MNEIDAKAAGHVDLGTPAARGEFSDVRHVRALVRATCGHKPGF